MRSMRSDSQRTARRDKGACFKSQKVEWSTPKAIYDALDREFHFNFDPCPLEGTADGLATLLTPWRGKRVFCNPPYGPSIGQWLRRGWEAECAVFLLPARTDTKWFHEEVLQDATEIRFIKGRLKFGGQKNSAPFPSMIVVYENSARCETGGVSQ